tara:strand:- start:348 stop:1847 length:1500 start_codon:yes stop_codon:yes gene_type:complete
MNKKLVSSNKKNFVLVASKQMTRDIEIFFCEKLKENKKLNVIFHLPNNNNLDKKKYIKKYPLSFDTIVQEPNEFDSLNEPVSRDYLYNSLSIFEKKFGMSVYRIFFTNRIIGSGFSASGGFNHPSTKLIENTTHFDVMKIALAKLIFWEKIFLKYNFKLAINLPDYAHIMASHYGITSERLQGARFGNTQFWSSDIHFQPDNLLKSFNTIKKKLDPVIIKNPYTAHITFRKKHIENFSLHKTLKDSTLNISKIIYGKIRGYKKSINQHIWSVFLGYWRRRNHYLKLIKKADVNLKTLSNHKYIFFPLQTEPEISVSGVADDFFFQLSAINLISRDLPSNYKIIVKEHLYAIGRRPTDFYDQIRSLKNVLIADPRDYGVEYVKKSNAVAGLTGTSSWEASVMGIPVISFSKNNAYNFLDHVFYIKETDSTKNLLPKILKKKWPSKKSLNDGAKFYNSYLKNSFDIGQHHEFISWKESNKKKKLIKKTALLLIKELFKKKI